MKKIITTLIFISVAISCQKPYKTKLDLAVDYYPKKGIVITSPEAGQCNIHITSSGSWTSSLEEGCDWATLKDSSGSGIGYVRFIYTENATSEDRSVLFTVTGQGKTICFPITQSKAFEL